MPEDFHFLNPEWFLALVPLGVLLWGMRSPDSGQSAWQRVVDGHLLPHLLTQGAGKARWLPLALLGAGWIMGVLALANPTFERLPTPVYRGQDARVVILDLSRSMETPDLKPSRLARARYKVADILERSRDGQTGLVAFAGDAFVVAPLSDDADTVLGLLDAVTPEIMPVQGSRPDLALHKAAELLAQAGAARGEVILVGDDAGDARAIEAARDLLDAGHELSIIGVGTEDGRPIPGVRDAEGHAVVAALDSARLIELAAAGGGAYAPLSADESDLDRVLRAPTSSLQQAAESPDRETDAWRELGPWIALALLPLGALAFRRGWLLGLVLVVSNAALVPEPAMALSWDDLWQRRDQQAADALERGDHGRALSLAEQPDQRGTASYRLGDYAAAAEAYARLDTADAHYNRGNALAKAGSPEEALAAYDQALSRQPGMEDAAYNKARIEEWLKQQQEQQQQSQDGQQSADRSQDSEGGEQSDDKAAEAEQHAENQSQAGQDDQPEEQGEKDGESADSDAGQDGRSAQE
ncbi:MAG: VWA domain-containing protein, partial [Pseudomonadota bacterium]|nr:VWA domain-containing protein [Pseudomonadota bacterium]